MSKEDTMKGHPIIGRAEAILVIRNQQDPMARMVMLLADALRNGWQVNHDLLRRQIAAQGRFALMERETALITLGGDDYQEPADWDWENLLAAIERDGVIEDLERAFGDEED